MESITLTLFTKEKFRENIDGDIINKALTLVKFTPSWNVYQNYANMVTI